VNKPFETITYEAEDGVATITLNRPEAINAFNRAMMHEMSQAWTLVREDDGVRAVVVCGAGDRGFCSGIDIKDATARVAHGTPNPFEQVDPGRFIGPKANQVWKPVVCAVHGLTAGGAFYWINESDIVICSDDAQFFDPHVSYGLTSALEPIGLRWRIPLGEVLRWALLGLDERIGAQRAHQIGLVSEVLPASELHARAQQLAQIIAAKPTVSTQGTVRAIWESMDLSRTVAQTMGLAYTQLGNPIGTAEVDRASVVRPKPTVR
jgi:enoyl-CoA hydratase/carnithine racemase